MSSLCEERHHEMESLKKEICCLREKKRCVEGKTESMSRCLDSIKGQVCQLTKANECAKRQRDEICRCNDSYKSRVRELEKELNQVNSIIDCLREKLNRLSSY